MSGHGLSEERIQKAFSLGKKWFELSNEEKAKYKLDLTEYVGWKGERVLLNADGTLSARNMQPKTVKIFPYDIPETLVAQLCKCLLLARMLLSGCSRIQVGFHRHPHPMI